MRWIVLFEDTKEMLAHRKRHGAAHLAYLDLYSDRILVGGGLRTDPDAPFCGGLWVVEATERGDVEDLVRHDPYFHPDHRSYRIMAWGKAIDRPVTL
ncbi:hypothetical protein NBRC116590_04110 [Pelagimonas sp. KU-00592-HH]|uniref:YciI family protein n=1 Tax=Pelagimonas sp. KU-00592-HH TaxID=3127651 RepID=UPI0031033B57